MSKEKSLFKSFMGTASIRLFASCLSVITGIIYARFLGPEQYGLYGYVMSIIALLTLPVTAGIPNLIIREIANFQLEEKWQYLQGIISWSRWYVLITSFVIVVVSILAIYYDFFKPSVAPLLLIALVTIPFRGLLTQQGAILNGFRRPVLAQVPSQVLAPVITLALLFFLVFNNSELTGEILIRISIVASLLAFALSAWYLNKIIKQESKIEKPKYLIKQWHLSLTPFTLMTIIGTLNAELASVFLGWLDSTESVAFFKVAMQGMILISLGLNSINSVIMPQVARFFRQGDLKQTQQLLTKSVRISSLVSLPIILVLIFFGQFAIEILFGKEYLSAYPLLVILCIGQAVNVLMGSVGLVLNMTNNEKYSLRSLLITLFISVVLLVFLIPNYSAIGAALVVSIGLILWNVLMAIDVYKLTGLRTWIM
ncbi:flippase [Psychromonas sp. MB-3u-54]|uniref:flippase n=1 Tax=Psychromonas sp. MB-3u-54 TaxID=2058319 RepID=UPI000C33F603|nr:flippase [Psychromonas sp. MB-3u-54]PKH03426.1 flippase [Psychromonas sp. MB-3u-54]